MVPWRFAVKRSNWAVEACSMRCTASFWGYQEEEVAVAHSRGHATALQESRTGHRAAGAECVEGCNVTSAAQEARIQHADAAEGAGDQAAAIGKENAGTRRNPVRRGRRARFRFR